MGVTHIVLFEFKADASADSVKKAQDDLLALYPNVKGGVNISSEAIKAPFTYGFVMEFEDEAKWNYYINEDPNHQAYKASLKDVVERVGVFDFQAGKF